MGGGGVGLRDFSRGYTLVLISFPHSVVCGNSRKIC